MRFFKFQARGRVSFFWRGATRFFLIKSSAKICKGVKNRGQLPYDFTSDLLTNSFAIIEEVKTTRRVASQARE